MTAAPDSGDPAGDPGRDPSDARSLAAGLLGADALGQAVDRLWSAIKPRRAVVGWGTVDLEHASSGVGVAAGRDYRGAVHHVPPDELLGARCRLVDTDHGEVLLMEPSTEGLLAAALARHGEGLLALYVEAEDAARRARRAGFRLSRVAAGPLGAERRIVVGGPDGPFVLVVDRD